jgi:hypothetical protein
MAYFIAYSLQPTGGPAIRPQNHRAAVRTVFMRGPESWRPDLETSLHPAIGRCQATLPSSMAAIS